MVATKQGGAMELIERAIADGQTALSEFEAKQLLASYQIPVTRECIANDSNTLIAAAHEIGYPIVLKGCSAEIAHKTEKGLIHVDIRNDDDARSAFDDIRAQMEPADTSILVQEYVRGQRELVVGLTRDPQFGPCVMFGLGGIFTEILKDISFRLAPLEREDAMEMMQEIKGHKILEAIRGMEAVDLNALSDILVTVGRIGLENEAIQEIDINPLILSGAKPIAVDALIVLKSQ
jgi:acetyl-CoA synthetase (ADP-forming)